MSTLSIQEWKTFFLGLFPLSDREEHDDWVIQEKPHATFSCPVFKPADFGLPIGFGRFEVIGHYATFVFIEARLAEALAERERENTRLRRLNERLMQRMNELLAAQAQLQQQFQPPSGSSTDPKD
ncbi:LysR family transcriptional regulator [Sesbania bispinosa]|nr:LysR family transcriptional regulator [Sesbania bispinosa]